MNQTKFRFSALSVLLFCSACSQRAIIGPEVRSAMALPDTWNQTRGFLDWTEADLSESEIQANALNYSFIWGGLVWQPASFRAANPKINVGFYIPSLLDTENGRPDPFPMDSQQDTPQRRARTLQWWNTEADGVGHPDWVMYQCDRRTPAYQAIGGSTLPNMPLDITNPEVIDWQLRAGDAASDFTVLSADLVQLRNFNHACGVYRHGEWLQLFSGADLDPTFASAILNWAQQIRAHLHVLPSPRGLVANFATYHWYSDAEIASLAANLDGVLDEQGFTAFGTAPLWGDAWLHKVRNMISIQGQGVAFYSVNYVSAFPPSQRETEWVLASFLMGRERSAYIIMTLAGVRWPHLSQYDEDVGHPCAPMRSFQNVYVRDYTKAMAVVNPSESDSHTVTLPSVSFRDLYGNPIEGGTLVLEPMTGKVLLRAASQCPQ